MLNEFPECRNWLEFQIRYAPQKMLYAGPVGLYKRHSFPALARNRSSVATRNSERLLSKI